MTPSKKYQQTTVDTQEYPQKTHKEPKKTLLNQENGVMGPIGANHALLLRHSIHQTVSVEKE